MVKRVDPMSRQRTTDRGRAGAYRDEHAERASLARAAVNDGVTAPENVAAYIAAAAPHVGCDVAQAREALRAIGRADLAR